jgi:chromosome segregation protein
MRLNQIKLSGFKSFAEPTTFQLPGQRVGVVGPNGCGKSNIMDAVRWVLGESKASELRGESMQDVIFNGSGQRKPASRASVELVFSNEDARAGGQWNAFAEIAVKRVLTRDGTSSYYINNQPVRRRDVQDVFLGTGLGPRAYAIIGQGTISRIIESRPEELRLFLEEAAGVSKYKERRRETESRLKDTRENLTRVEDILRELNSNLEKLEKQAEVASRYHGLNGQATLKQHQLWFLKHRDAAAEETRVKAEFEAATNALESRTAELRAAESDLETLRQTHYATGDEMHQRQGALADAQLAVSRLEERIRYVLEGRQRAQARLDELSAQNQQWAQRRQQADEEAQGVGAQLAQGLSQAQALADAVTQATAALPALLEALRAAQASSNEQRDAVRQVQQQISLLSADTRSVEEQRRQAQARVERLGNEQRQLQAPDESRIAQLQAQHAQALAAHGEAELALTQLTEQGPALEAKRRQAQETLKRESGRQSEISARLSALRALQEKVQTEGKLKPWLAKHGLDSAAGLWRKLHIESGWETALEAALRERMGALEVSRLDTAGAFAADAPPAKLAFYTLPHAPSAPQPGAAAHGLPTLAAKLQLADASLKALLADWLEGVYVADSMAHALAQRSQLHHGEVVMTREGHAVSAQAVQFHAQDSQADGLLARAQEIENLDRNQRAQALIVEEAQAAAVQCDAAATQAQAQLAKARMAASEAQTRAHQLQVELLRLTQAAQAAQARRHQLDSDVAEVQVQLKALQERIQANQERFERLDVQLGQEQERHAAREDEVIAADATLAAAREAQRQAERRAQQAQYEQKALEARAAELQRQIDTAQQQMAANSSAGEQLQLELGSLDDSAAQAGLQDALSLRVAREGELASTRSRYDDLTARLRSGDESRLSLERSLEPMREKLTTLQLEQQAAQLGGAQYLEQLEAAGVDRTALGAQIEADGVKLWGLQTEIDRLQKEINALGAVNLAALEELTTSRERKGFLDAQNADLLDAMKTLEDAIHKIDLETRDLLQQTFEQVNGHFGRMFPQLFGGGNARLVMTGDEILDAGVQVMAQPPGKKNSTIHLLSGGEKALTAIALVFAIFQLNPAPFCLLDEVDAPLDDANTERYARLVNEMSAGTQFLFISHNKIAMEMAEQLIGVTMQEQGVSRIVAVDMAAAVTMAEAA